MHILILSSSRLVAVGLAEPDIVLSCSRYIYSLGVLRTMFLKGKWSLTKLRTKHKVLEDSDDFPNIGFTPYRRYWFRKCRVHFWLGHDGCYDDLMERKIGALLPLGPSVLSFVVVTW